MVDEEDHVGAEDASEGESEGIDLEQILEVAGFVLRSGRRRPKIATATFLLVASLGVAVAAVMPRTYSSEVKLLAQRPSTIRMLSGSNPFGMEAVDNPTRNIAAMITRRDNIVTLAKESNLVKRFQETRPAPLRAKDRVMSALFGPPSDEGMLASMVAQLEAKLDVETDEPTSTVTIKVDWSNPRIAYDLVTLVQKNFLEARYDSDVAVINDSISVLEDHAQSELERVKSELDDYQKLLAERTKTTATEHPALPPRFRLPAAPAAAATIAAPPPEPTVDPELVRALELKRQQIRAAEDARQRIIADLNQQLMQAQLTLTPMHPTVMALRERLEAVSQPSPEIEQLRSEERALAAQAGTKSAAPPPLPVPSSAKLGGPLGPRTTVLPPAPEVPALPPVVENDGVMQLAQSKLASAIHAYQDATSRIDSAKVELDITRAAYKYKYTVVSPADIPSRPTKATAQLVGVGSFFGGAVLAILLAALSDVLGGIVLESWQVRRRLRLDVLGELDRPS
ncbi:MAG TPA: hypothetical protein VKU41_11020 [Polyangiaceae bacterium]|nr:hypothetical protein [Polyangiaceae bacterium]